MVSDIRLEERVAVDHPLRATLGHLLIENRNGLAVEASLTHATGTAERAATLMRLVMPDRRQRKPGITLGADKA